MQKLAEAEAKTKQLRNDNKYLKERNTRLLQKQDEHAAQEKDSEGKIAKLEVELADVKGMLEKLTAGCVVVIKSKWPVWKYCREHAVHIENRQ
jgi:predicted nuclease with TOPRIM domain